MEAKILHESQTMLKKMFQDQDKENTGLISSKALPTLLETLHLDIEVKEEEIKSEIGKVDPEGKGLLSYESFSKVILYFLVKEAQKEVNAFSDKRDISLGFFGKS